MKLPALALALAAALPALAAAHSWIVCTDYLENNGWYWDEAKCRAWPRSAARYNLRNGQFGTQNEYAHRLDNHPETNPLCETARNDDTEYTDSTPMAAYYLGQKVVLPHPTNGHVADVRCKDKNVKDIENLMFVVDGDQDPCCIDSDKLIQIFDMGRSPYGRHTFVWKWIRTPTVNPFTTCWEADVFATKAERDAHYLATGRTTVDMWDFYEINNIVDGEIVDPVDPPVNEIITG
ncbi:PREDICTED: uncharacterized protein LOC109469590 [Branchiostoma belcheri]|uniref:Uncharacterized protein LOC109469590 n=1 Tax=Branchiostoma belcheri TaxID=7741 RepID=A0A6P4YY03_BRABE|nr:PREDICTED: uncharacterized protein LOC109469590 [Branchiostoma belcheri]